jgi:hypothetical protein
LQELGQVEAQMPDWVEQGRVMVGTMEEVVKLQEKVRREVIQRKNIPDEVAAENAGFTGHAAVEGEGIWEEWKALMPCFGAGG